MPHHESVSCPRCGRLFECKMGSITICHCSSVVLTKSQREHIAQRWESCLCHSCLLEVAAQPQQSVEKVPVQR